MATTMYSYPRRGQPAGTLTMEAPDGTLTMVPQADLIASKTRGIAIDVGGVPYGVAFIVRDDLLSSRAQVKAVLASLVAAITADAANALVPVA